MKFKIYTSYNTFFENYEKDLLDYLKENTSLNESDFAHDYSGYYIDFKESIGDAKFWVIEYKNNSQIRTKLIPYNIIEVFKKQLAHFVYVASKKEFYKNKFSADIDWNNLTKSKSKIFEQLSNKQYIEFRNHILERGGIDIDYRFIELSKKLISDYLILDKKLDSNNVEVNFLYFDSGSFFRNEYKEQHLIYNFLIEKSKIPTTKKLVKKKLSNPKKLALLHELGIFDLPKMKNLSDDRQNEIIGLLLDADKTEFVYKNRLNINSIDPRYQTDKYTSYHHLDEMKKLLEDI